MSVGYGGGNDATVSACELEQTHRKKFQPTIYSDQLDTLHKAIITLRDANDIEPSQIINMDQTMCRFDMPLNRTNHKKGAKTIKTTWVGMKGFTVDLITMAAGEKLPAVIIFIERGGSFRKRV